MSRASESPGLCVETGSQTSIDSPGKRSGTYEEASCLLADTNTSAVNRFLELDLRAHCCVKAPPYKLSTRQANIILALRHETVGGTSAQGAPA